MPAPGKVYYLPPEEAEGPTKGDRPHLVLSVCDADAETATFAYCSTKATDAANGARHIVVDPFATSYRGTGLQHATYVYPGRLISYDIMQLPEESGRIMDEMPMIRRELQTALGHGRGVTTNANVRGSNRRGRIIQYKSDLANLYGTEYALVVTEPEYSRAGYQQVTIPLLDAAEYDAHSGDVVIRAGNAVSHLFNRIIGSRRPAEVIAAVPYIVTVFERHGIERFSSTVVDEETMSAIDVALAIHFGF
jgi:hypothetical protein